MSVNLESQYPGKVDPSSSEWPYGEPRNITVPGDGTGTPWEAAGVKDLFAMLYAPMLDAGEVPSGTPDSALNSQWLASVLFRGGVVVEDYAELRAKLAGAKLKAGTKVIVRQPAGPELVIAVDGAGGNFTDDGGVTITATGAVTGAGDQYALRNYSGDVNVGWFGAVGDGVTNDTVAITAAKAVGGPLVFPGGNYVVTGPFEMPQEFRGDFTVTGDITWTTVKHVKQSGKLTVNGTVLMSGVWYSFFEYIDCQSNDFTLDGNQPVWGTFWNLFGFIRCEKLIFDVDQGQSVNANVFQTVRAQGGVHISGTATTGIREAHNNMIMNLDTTGADMTATDGTTGVHILNDSDLNQTNTVLNWYAESTGRRLVKGNWCVLGSNVDAGNNPIAVDRNNSVLFGRDIGRNGNYLATGANMSRGGDWSELGTDGLPVDMTGGNITPVSLTDAADGNDVGARQVGGSTFRSFSIRYPLTTRGRVNAVFFVYEEGTPSSSVEIYDGAGGLVSAGVGMRTPIGGGWYLLRVSGQGGVIDEGAGETIGQIRIYTTTSSALTASDLRIISSYFVSTEDTALLPFVKQGPRTSYGATAPTGGVWRQGDVAINDAYAGPSDVFQWVCVAGGSPGTWEAVVGSPDEFFYNVSGTIQSSDGTVTIATVDLVAFSGRQAEITVHAKCRSGTGGVRQEYRRSIAVENGGGSVSETNLDFIDGGNMTLSFTPSGDSVLLQLATSIASMENFDFVITVKGPDAGSNTTINYS